MVRSLRAQLTVTVVATVGAVLAATQWAGTRLATQEHALALHAQVLPVLRAVAVLWTRDGLDEAAGMIAVLTESNVAIDSIDLVGVAGDAPALRASSPPPRTSSPLVPEVDVVHRLETTDSVEFSSSRPDGTTAWHVAVPVREAGRLTGVVEAELATQEGDALHARLRTIDASLMLLALGAISAMLMLLLGRRVAAPVTALVAAMQSAEHERFDITVRPQGSAEFVFLATSLNRLLARVREMTTALDQRLVEAQIELGHRERLAALGQMAATVAHELGTPLGAVLGYSQLLREELAPEQARKVFVIERQVTRMIETIRGILARTRGPRLVRGRVDVRALVHESLALVAVRMRERRLRARCDVSATLPSVSVDALALRQVLVNLLTNAIEATSRPGCIVVAAAVSSTGDRPRLELSVADEGRGMTPEEVERMWKPLYTTKGEAGTGLGLAIVDDIVTAHGGEVRVDTRPGTGTTVRVLLPLEE